jgi:hypothetical protein
VVPGRVERRPEIQGNNASLNRVAFVAAFPVNRHLIARSRSHAVVTSTTTTRVVYLQRSALGKE